MPSSGQVLRLATVPFRIVQVYPTENTEVAPGAVMTVLASAPMDPARLAGVKLNSGTEELAVRRALSLDGRTLVITPEQALPGGVSLTLKVEGLASLAGETAPALTRTFRTAAVPEPPVAVDFGRIDMGYPDADYNAALTIPEGAIPKQAGLISTPQTGPLTLLASSCAKVAGQLSHPLTTPPIPPAPPALAGWVPARRPARAG